MIEQHGLVELVGKPQNYDWGICGADSLVARLHHSNTGVDIDGGMPYAELWMGTHPNGPSTLKSGQLLKDYLGKDLPFLFKVLSVKKALSIQAHPDADLARRLHRDFPRIYKDPNHKPEIAIALTQFEALCGFRRFGEIIEFLTLYPEFAALFSKDTLDGFMEAPSKESLKMFFGELMRCDPQLVSKQTKKLLARLEEPNLLEQLFIRLNTEYPEEVGCFCIFVLNYVMMAPGECVFLAANEPHAYLSGECVECMALSDNVVRAGLTPKFRDVDTLLEMLTYKTFHINEVLNEPVKYPGYGHTIIYRAPVKEFSVLKTELAKGQSESLEIRGSSESILMITQGCATIKFNGRSKEYTAGTILLLPKNANIDFSCPKESCLVFQAFAPLN